MFHQSAVCARICLWKRTQGSSAKPASDGLAAPAGSAVDAWRSQCVPRSRRIRGDREPCDAAALPDAKVPHGDHLYTARDLLKMPLEERDRILEEMAIIAEPLYRNDPELTAFEAFGPDDLYGESASSEPL